MARERGLYRRKDSPFWWIDVVLADGRRVCRSTRLQDEQAAEEYVVRLKAEAFEAVRRGIPTERSWQDAVVRYMGENRDKRTRDDDQAHLRKLDPFLAGKRLQDVTMDALWPFVHHRRDVDGVTNATINRALEVVRRVLRLAQDEWGWLERVPKVRMLREPQRRIRFLTHEDADRLFAELPVHLRPPVQFALATGCRWARSWPWSGPGSTSNGAWRGSTQARPRTARIGAFH